ncbi:arylsulfatase b [Plakobranchus ocellatus]|uniref:Arylsulfatase b n=1 Tax=Plakobranchus ocellatus TaxID=259542 RepID=A0AAV3YYR6_9GAST|nr:arylsulfatase b [Plakobranchus ocellatus]
MSLYATLVLANILCLFDQSLAASTPNIVFVLADDYGYNDIGYHGSQIQTPTLDKLADSGVKLENYYVQPICTPTRSQLMSGRYQIHTGLQHGIIWPEQPNGLPLNSPTLADKMKEAGYSTHMVGKWHLGFYRKEYLPWNRGFDTYFGYLTGSEDYYKHTRGFKFTSKAYLDLHNEQGPVKNESGHYSAHLFTQKAIDVINNHNEKKPLFLYLAYQSVHGPLEVPQHYEDKYEHIQNKERRTYAGMVSAMDEGVRNVTEALKSKGLWSNTVFIFSTDNGGIPKVAGNNFPLRGHKGTLWDGGMHGVGFVAGGVLKPDRAGKVSKDLIHVSDWYPTLVGLAKGSFNGCLPLDGVDQWDTINSGMPSKRLILLHNIDPLHQRSGLPLYPNTWDTSVRAAIRSGSYKLITGDPGPGDWTPPPDSSDEQPKSNDVTSLDKSLYFQTETSSLKNVWLFNITADPTEHNDLSEERPEVVKAMLTLLSKINATAVPVRYPPFDPSSDPAQHGDVWGPWE